MGSDLHFDLPREIRSAPSLVCIESGKPLECSASNELVCVISGRRYPVLDGIPVLTEDPDGLIRSFGKSWTSDIEAVEKEEKELPRLRGTGVRDGWLDRATSQVQGRRANVAALKKYLAPIEDYLRTHAGHISGSAALLQAHGAGWSLDAMLPYFAQDWSDSPDFERVKMLLVSDLEKYAPDRRRVAVLGAGACGIVRATANLFDEIYGVDLSLPTLLLARGLLTGDAITLHLQQLAWMGVALKPPAAVRKPIFLVASNANRLPFADDSVSALVTQYLMDLMRDPIATGKEILRVLQPGGIWVNFSNPLVLPEEESRFGRPDIKEMPSLFAPLGFETLQCERERFTLLNLDHLTSHGHRSHQEVHHFVMKRALQVSSRPSQSHDLRAEDHRWWQQTARRSPHRIVETARKTVFEVAQIGTRFEIGVSGNLVSSDESTIQFFELLMRLIDGRRCLSEIYDSINANVPIERNELKTMLLAMERDFGVISFVDPCNART